MAPRLVKRHLGKREPRARGPRLVVDNSLLAQASESYELVGTRMRRALNRKNRRGASETEEERRARTLKPLGGA